MTTTPQEPAPDENPTPGVTPEPAPSEPDGNPGSPDDAAADDAPSETESPY